MPRGRQLPRRRTGGHPRCGRSGPPVEQPLVVGDHTAPFPARAPPRQQLDHVRPRRESRLAVGSPPGSAPGRSSAPRDRDPLALAAGESSDSDRALASRDVKQPGRPPSASPPRQADQVRVEQSCSRPVRYEISSTLENEPDLLQSQPRQLGVRRLRDVLAIQAEPAAIRGQQRAGDRQQRRLAEPTADQGAQLARRRSSSRREAVDTGLALAEVLVMS